MADTTRVSGAQPDGMPTPTRILFGHQSVGSNLLTGVTELGRGPEISELPLDSHARIVPGINHFRVGRNRDPDSKLPHFFAMVAKYGNECDLALMKFCYVDIAANTVVKALFARYLETMLGFQERYPLLRIGHVTVPLRTLRHGLRSRLRKLLGAALPAFEDNLKRERFNDLLRDRSGGDGLVFDLAASESRRRGNDHYAVAYRGSTVRGLNPNYTDDGGHLNRHGRQRVADACLEYLRVVQSRSLGQGAE